MQQQKNWKKVNKVLWMRKAGWKKMPNFTNLSKTNCLKNMFVYAVMLQVKLFFIFANSMNNLNVFFIVANLHVFEKSIS